MAANQPLAGLRVVDLSDGASRAVGKMLAELGAEVVCQNEPDSAQDAVYQRGKNWIEGGADEEALLDWAKDGDLLIASQDQFPNGRSVQDFARKNPALVILIISPFGLDNGLSKWKGGEAIFQALGGQLSRSGIPERAPLLAPGMVAAHSAMTQALFLALTACLDQRACGQGQIIDFAAVEGAAQALDPGYGIQGSATSGIPASKLPKGRPEARFQYPIVKCQDGFARVCILSPRQWKGMFEWLGRPEEFADPAFSNLLERYRSPTLIPAIAQLFATKSRAEIEAEGVQFGVPTAGLATLEEAIENEHFAARKSLFAEKLPDGRSMRHVAPPIEIDGERRAPAGRALANWSAREECDGQTRTDQQKELPLAGLRVLDLGVIVVGAEAGRLFADHGADVIKVENPSFPDGSRQTRKGVLISPGFAAGHRNQRSLAINLREAAGRDLLLKLAAKSDVVLANFKPGTLETLGIGAEQLLEANPSIILVESNAFGSSGPWSNRGGYGPLVRAAAGLTYMWRYEDDPLGFSDALTVYPDHAAGRMSAIAALALLLRRSNTGTGGHANIAQVEVMLSHLATKIAENDTATKSATEQFVVTCAGDDEWCVVEAQNEDDRQKLRDAMQLGAEAALEDVQKALFEFAANRSPLEAATALQEMGVAAAPMLRVSDMAEFPYFVQRKFLRTFRHPHLDAEYLIEAAPVSMSKMALPPDRPAPLMGEHSREIGAQLLGLSEQQIEQLVAEKILHEAITD